MHLLDATQGRRCSYLPSTIANKTHSQDRIVCNRGTAVLAVLENGIVAYGLLHDEAGSSVMEGGICLSVAVS
jgi:hypothetical protein